MFRVDVRGPKESNANKGSCLKGTGWADPICIRARPVYIGRSDSAFKGSVGPCHWIVNDCHDSWIRQHHSSVSTRCHNRSLFVIMPFNKRQFCAGIGFGRDLSSVPPPTHVVSLPSPGSSASISDLNRKPMRNARFMMHADDSFVCDVDERSGHVGLFLPCRRYFKPSASADESPPSSLLGPTITCCQSRSSRVGFSTSFRSWL